MTITFAPTETSVSVLATVLETVVDGVTSTTCELPSRVLSVMLSEPVAATVPVKNPPPAAPVVPAAPVPRVRCLQRLVRRLLSVRKQDERNTLWLRQ